MKVDLGCGKIKQPGFIGIDRYQLEGVDIVCDINEGIPINDNSVDYLLASHSLEHVNDLLFVMSEIYRICKHKSIVCIVAPYYNTSLNIANPYHKHAFNEHTPRFFTSNNSTILSSEEYNFPASQWGLGISDNSELELDFRCINMEFFYFPQYKCMSEEERRRFRGSQTNVVDQIVYHLLVVKEDMDEKEVQEIISRGNFEEPYFIRIRKLSDQLDCLRYNSNLKVTDLENEVIKKNNDIVSLDEQIAGLRTEVKALNSNYEEEIIILKEENAKLMDAQKEEIEKFKEENERILSFIDKACSENRTLQNELTCCNELSYAFTKKVDIELNAKYYAISSLVYENKKYRDRKIVKVLNRVIYFTNRNKLDLGPIINDECREIMDSSILNQRASLDKYCLTMSNYIQKNDILYYFISPDKSGWNGIDVVFSYLNYTDNERPLGIEILSEDSTILRSVPLDSNSIRHNQITSVRFDPINGSENKRYVVRFMGLDGADAAGLCIYHWERYRLPLGKRSNLIFARLSYN